MSSSKNDPKADAADDLDDLDDILDEFNAAPSQSATNTKVSNEAGQPSSSSVQPNPKTDSVSAATAEKGEEETEDQLNERFARELAEGMEALMKGVNPENLPTADQGQTEGEGLPNEEEMMRQFEQMMADMGFGGAPPGNSTSNASGSGPTASGSKQGPSVPPANFQDAIKSTMSRLRESDQTATSNATQANEMDFEKLMEALGNVSGAEGEEGVAAMLENMMSELMGKEVLYEPLKELRDKYPAYLANPPAQLSTEDRTRFEEQQKIVNEVVATFENPKFENGSETEKSELKSKVQKLMNEMQDQGAPPQEIIGDLPPELGNMPGLGGDENCSVM